MAPTREIPGFYYDELKGKYFRIQPNHKVSAGSSAHTSASVKELQDEKKLKISQMKRQMRYRHGTVKRSFVTRSSTSYATLLHRLGNNQIPAQQTIAKNYAQKLRFKDACCIDVHKVGASRYASCPSSSFHVTDNGALLTEYTTSATQSAVMYMLPTASNLPGEFAYVLPDEGVPDTLSAGFGIIIPPGFSPGNHLYSSLSDRVLISASSWGSLNLAYSPTHHNVRLPLACQHFNVSQICTSIWDIAASSKTQSFALATDSGLCVMRLEALDDCRSNWHNSRNEQMNVVFKDANVIMSGERSGRINFADSRLSINLSASDVDRSNKVSSVLRIAHSSAVVGTAARTQNENHVIVQGFDTTSVYDLRYVKALPQPTKTHHKSGKMKYQSSKALFDFCVPRERHTNHYTMGKKLSYHPDLDIIAAASSNPTFKNKNHFVTLYSAADGKLLDSPLTRTTFEEEVTCLKFARTRDGLQNLLTLSKGRLLEWGDFGITKDNQSNGDRTSERKGGDDNDDDDDDDDDDQANEAAEQNTSAGKKHDMRQEAARLMMEGGDPGRIVKEWERSRTRGAQ